LRQNGPIHVEKQVHDVSCQVADRDVHWLDEG
jgi:hypothetical protein